MTDNEKRAHDLTLTMIPIIYDKYYKDTGKQGGNCFEIYKELYVDVLQDFKNDFKN
jgi:hypothetical protein